MIALLTNDDGIDAPGLRALEEAAAPFFREIWVVAPLAQMSQIGHRVTTDEPVQVESRGERRFAVAGTPADCVRLAHSVLLPQRPDRVLSGINHGGNLGRHDAAISGTVAAVREAAFAGIPGVAVSHYLRRGLPVDWALAAERVRQVLDELIQAPHENGHFWSVNLPHTLPGEPEPQAVHCEQERHSLQVRFFEVAPGSYRYAGDYHERPRIAGSDVEVCFGGNIAISRMTI